MVLSRNVSLQFCCRMSTEAGKHTGSGGHQDNYSMEDRASKLQVERDQDSDVQQAVGTLQSLLCTSK